MIKSISPLRKFFEASPAIWCSIAFSLQPLNVLSQAVDAASIANAMFIGRAIERILIVCICGVSIVLGFFLFRIVFKDASSVTAKGGQFEFSATRIGPGVFFCAFGVVGLVYALQSQPRIEVAPLVAPTSQTPASNEKSLVAIGAVAGGASKNNLLEARIASLNTAIGLVSKAHGEAPPPAKALGHDAASLRAWREDLIMERVGEQKYAAYLLEMAKPGAGRSKSDNVDASKIVDEVESLRNLVTTME